MAQMLLSMESIDDVPKPRLGAWCSVGDPWRSIFAHGNLGKEVQCARRTGQPEPQPAMSTARWSDAVLADAAGAIRASQAYQAGKSEQFLNKLGRHSHHCFLCCSMPSTRYSPLVLGDRAHAVSGSTVAITIKDLAGSATLDIVKDKISHFAENSRALVGVLDEVSKAHPFILSMSLLSSVYSTQPGADVYSVVAAATFKVAITLELNRRENDQKVITLHVAMCDMMQVVVLSVKCSLL